MTKGIPSFAAASEEDERFFINRLAPDVRVLHDAMQGRYESRNASEVLDSSGIATKDWIETLFQLRRPDEVVLLVLWSWSDDWADVMDAYNDGKSWTELYAEGRRWSMRGEIHPDVPSASVCRRLIGSNPYEFGVAHFYPRALDMPEVVVR